MSTLERTPADYDAFWKDALDLFLPDFIALAAPDLFAATDWARGFGPVEAELLPAQTDDHIGKRFPDRLFEVWLLTGECALLLIHVEIQAEPQADFARRMFVYRYRLFDRRAGPVFSIAILADEAPRFRPSEFVDSCFGSEVRFRFRTLKLLDFRDRIDELAASDNPFLILIAIHLRTRETQPDRRRLLVKTQFLRRLVEKGFARLRIVQLTKLLTWLMILPAELALEFRREIVRLEEDSKMQIMTDYELEAMERGRAEARVRTKCAAIVEILRARFGDLPAPLSARIDLVLDDALLDRLIRLSATCRELSEVARAIE